jgi:hypothetical protein
LKQNKTIRRFIAFLLLVVFAISVAPKSYFHDALANHNDVGQICTDNLNSPHFHQSGINCHFDQLVISSLFHFSAESFSDFSLSFLSTPHHRIETSYLLHALVAKENRGPPALYL